MAPLSAIKLTEWIQLATTAIGFVFVVIQLRNVRRATEGKTHADLYGQYMDVGKLFLSKPHLRPYFYESKEIDGRAADSDQIREEVAIMCELVASLLEHAALQQTNMTGESWEECWEAYTHERLRTSPALRRWWRDNENLYAASFGKVVNAWFERFERQSEANASSQDRLATASRQQPASP